MDAILSDAARCGCAATLRSRRSSVMSAGVLAAYTVTRTLVVASGTHPAAVHREGPALLAHAVSGEYETRRSPTNACTVSRVSTDASDTRPVTRTQRPRTSPGSRPILTKDVSTSD